LMPRGNRHGSRTHPERVARGERHGARLHPERWPRGDFSFPRLHPERLRHGANHPATSFTDDQALEIRRRARTGESLSALGREFGVHHSTIARIRDGKTWRSLEAAA
jgi:hypothetical protein